MPPAPAPAVLHSADPAAVALRERRGESQRTALIVAAAGAGMALLAVLVAGVLRRGRRRGWRPADPEPPATPPVATPPDG